jgi:hypothetical protein
MSGRIIEDEELLRAAEYALTIMRRTEDLASADGLVAEYQAALVPLTAYVQALQTAIMTSRERPGS